MSNWYSRWFALVYESPMRETAVLLRTVGAKIQYLLLDRGSKGKYSRTAGKQIPLLTPQKELFLPSPFPSRDRGPQGCVFPVLQVHFLLPHLSLCIPHSFKMILNFGLYFITTKHDKNISLDKQLETFPFSVFLFSLPTLLIQQF